MVLLVEIRNRSLVSEMKMNPTFSLQSFIYQTFMLTCDILNHCLLVILHTPRFPT